MFFLEIIFFLTNFFINQPNHKQLKRNFFEFTQFYYVVGKVV